MSFIIALLVCLFSQVLGDVNLSDVAGTYRLIKGRYSYKKLEIYGNGSQIGAQDILFDGSEICEGAIFPQLITPTSAAEKQKYGTYVRDRQPSMECGRSHGRIVNFRVLRPVIDVTETVLLALLSPIEVQLLAGSKYVHFKAEFGTSMYMEVPTTKTQGSRTSTSTTETETQESDVNKNTEGGEQDMWKWLGPVLGALATVLAAVITVRCAKNRKDVG